MDKLPVTPSPHRFLLKSKNTPHLPPASRNQPSSHQSGHGLSALEDKVPTPRTAAAFELATTVNANRGVDTRTKYQTRNLGLHADSASPAATEGSKLCTHNGLETSNAGTGRSADLVQVQEDATGSEMRRSENLQTQEQIAKESAMGSEREPTNAAAVSHVSAERMRTPSLSQFKAAPKFRFGSSQNRSRSGSGVEGERTNTEIRSKVTPRPPQGRWKATQTPLRQSLRREPTEEEIVDVVENEMLMEDVRQSVERADSEDGHERGQRSYVELNFATPAAKRRKISADPVEPLSFFETQLHDDQEHHDPHDGGYADQAAKILEGEDSHGNDGVVMLHNDDHQEELLLDGEHPTTSQSIVLSHHQPATPVPTYSQRPRFILPSSTRRPPTQPATPQQHPPHETFAPTPHFILHTPAPAHTPADDEPQFIRPPKFRRVEEPEPCEPLPAEFSPRKRGQKFVIGGLASEVRSWLVDLETQNSASTSRQQKDDEGWMAKMLIEEANGGRGVGWRLARGKLQDGEGLRMILGGEGMVEGLEKGKDVVKGGVVGIRAPVWEVEVEGVRWGVGANWKAWARG